MCCNDKYLENLQAINELYDYLNDTFFDSALSKVVITISSEKKENILGHYTPRESGQATDGDKSQEINLAASHLARSPLDIACTLIHEMCHHYAHINKIQDTSRGGVYHNKKFKEIAEARGLDIGFDKTIGHSPSSLKPATAELLEACEMIKKMKGLKRIEIYSMGGAKKKSSTRKYVCPNCGQSIRATKAANIICGECWDNEDEVIKMRPEEDED